MPDDKPADAPVAFDRRKASNAFLMVVLFDLLVVVPYTYWRLHRHAPVLIITYAVEGVGMLLLLYVALHLRRRGN
jgi:hypothetical protein